MHGGQSDLHIIIHGQGQKLSLLRFTPFKQSAEETRGNQQGRQTFEQSERDIFRRSDRDTKRYENDLWNLTVSDQNQEMEIESLQIQIILSTKQRNQTAKSMCL